MTNCHIAAGRMAKGGRSSPLAVWLGMFFGTVQLPTRFDPMSWHIRELLVGFRDGRGPWAP